MVAAKQRLTSNAPRLCNPHGVASLHFSKVDEPAILIADIAPLARSKIKKPSTEVAYLVGSTF
jgi:hypothetical protein